MTKPNHIPIEGDSDAVARWLWRHLVPKSGQSAWVQGELLRCVEKLRWEAQTNGNANWDRGFKRLADYLERTLCDEQSFSAEALEVIRDDVAILRSYRDAYTDDDVFDRLTDRVVDFCRAHPAPIPKPPDPRQYR